MSTGADVIEDIRRGISPGYPCEREWTATVNEIAELYVESRDLINGLWLDDRHLLDLVGRCMSSGDRDATLAAIGRWRRAWLSFLVKARGDVPLG